LYINFKFCFSFWKTLSPGSLPGFAPGSHWETSVPQTPARPQHVNSVHYKILGTPMVTICNSDLILGLLPFFLGYVVNRNCNFSV